MNKEFCTYEQALALKELGFDEPCLAKHDLKYILLRVEECKSQENAQEFDYILAPLYQQAFRWFREKHDLFYSVVYKDDEPDNKFEGSIWKKDYYLNVWNEIYNTHEEAEQACLDKLIETIKNK